MNHDQDLELFLFVESETPAARDWADSYLKRKGIVNHVEIPIDVYLPQFLADVTRSHFRYMADMEKFAYRMKNAWRVREHRKQKNTKPLTVFLNPDVMRKISVMSKGLTKAELITQLVEGNYQTFLARRHELELKKAEAKEIDKRRKELNQLKKMMSKPVAESSLITRQLRVANNLKDIISMLDDITAELTNKEA